MNDASPWVLAARSVIEDGPVTADQLDSPAHLRQHPDCGIAGQAGRVLTRCCGKPIALPRPMWPCEIPADTGLSLDCCERSFIIYGNGG